MHRVKKVIDEVLITQNHEVNKRPEVWKIQGAAVAAEAARELSPFLTGTRVFRVYKFLLKSVVVY